MIQEAIAAELACSTTAAVTEDEMRAMSLARTLQCECWATHSMTNLNPLAHGLHVPCEYRVDAARTQLAVQRLPTAF